jgi:apolipoprotein N-acyltransferase
MLRQIKYFSVKGLKALLLCFLSSVILTLPFTNGRLWIFAWFGFLPLFVALKDKSGLQAFLLAYFAGIIFWAGTIWWLVHVTLAGTILLILYLALYFGLFGFFVSSYLLSTTYLPALPVRQAGGRQATYCLLFISSIWVLLEYIRSHLLTGFPWALLGYSQYLNLPIIQIADVTGAWGVSFLIMLVNIVVYLALIKKQKRAIILSCLLCVLVSLGYGYYKINFLKKSAIQKSIRVSVVQGNIPQDLKWDINLRDFIIDRYVKLTLQAIKDNPDLIIWPEAALPVVLEEEPFYYEKVKDLVKEIKTPVVLGAVTLRNGHYYNSSLLVSDQGENLELYDKLHLVPFGEYIPLKKILGFLETVVPIGEITPGKEYKVFKRPAKFSVLICFEDLFPELSRRFVKKGANFLVNITNDAWYKMSSAPYQHLQASVFRAVENRVFLVRSANTGVSCFIGPSGEVVSYVKDNLRQTIFNTGYDTQRIFVEKGILSFYTARGDVFILLLFIFTVYGIFRSVLFVKRMPLR